MKLYTLIHREQYDGDTVLSIFDSRQKAEVALQAYLQDNNEDQEDSLEIVETTLNDKPDWDYMNPELQAYYTNQG